MAPSGTFAAARTSPRNAKKASRVVSVQSQSSCSSRGVTPSSAARRTTSAHTSRASAPVARAPRRSTSSRRNTTGTTSIPAGTRAPAAGTTLPIIAGADSAAFHSTSNTRRYSRDTPSSPSARCSAGESRNVVRQ